MSSSRAIQDKGKIKLVEEPMREKVITDDDDSDVEYVGDMNEYRNLMLMEEQEEDNDVEYIGPLSPNLIVQENEGADVQPMNIEIPMKKRDGVEEIEDFELVSVIVNMEGRRIEQGQSSHDVALTEARRCCPNHEPRED